MGNFVTDSPHVPLATDRTDAVAPRGVTFELPAAYVNGERSAINDLYTHVGTAFVNVKDYGAVGDGFTDDTAAIQTAFTVAATITPTGVATSQVFFPPGTYKCGAISIANVPGILVQGAGKWCTRLLWNGVAGASFLQFVNCQQWHIEDLSLDGSVSAPPGIMVESKYDASGTVNYVPTAMSIQDCIIGWSEIPNSFTTGVAFTYVGTNANNADGYFKNVQVIGAINAGWSLQASQCRNHFFEFCTVVDAAYGIRTDEGTGGQGGDFRWFGGSFAGVTKSCFHIGADNAGITVMESLAEDCHRFFENYDQDGTPDGSNFGSSGSQTINLICNKVGNANSAPADNRTVCLKGAGPFNIIGNNFAQAGPTYPLHIAIVSTGFQRGKVEGNTFYSPDVTDAPIEYISAATGVLSAKLHLGANVFLDALYNPRHLRSDICDVPSSLTTWNIQNSGNRQERLTFTLTAASLTAASTQQVLQLPPLPNHLQVRDVYLEVEVNFAFPSGSNVMTAQIGQTSGDNDVLLQSRLDSGGNAAPYVYGNADADLGRAVCRGGKVQGGLAAIPQYNAAQPALYVTFKAAQNFGNGTTTSLTTGQLVLSLEVEAFPGQPF